MDTSENPDFMRLLPESAVEPPKPLYLTERPFLRTLRYIVQEARKHHEAGHDDHFVHVGRVAEAALMWEQADRTGSIHDAEYWLERLP